MASTEQAKSLREEGNVLYKGGKLYEAIEKYLDAIDVAPDDPGPLGNLSAAFYEIGSYKESIDTAKAALKLIAQDVPPAAKAKLTTRIAKAEAHLHTVSHADKLRARNRILKKMPRYHPTMLKALEYYTIGHDDAFSFFDDSFEAKDPLDSEKMEISFFFAGIGDARHLYRTIIDIAQNEKYKKTKKRDYHFLINDVNINALSRNVIILMMVEELAGLDRESTDASLLLTTLFFTFNGSTMPKYCFEKLQEIIGKTITALKGDAQLIEWLYIPDKQKHLHIRALQQWQAEARTQFDTSHFIKSVYEAHTMKRETSTYEGHKACRNEETLYSRTTILFPPDALLLSHDKELLELKRNYESKPKGNASKFKEHVLSNWRTNVTLIDMEWITSEQYLDLQFDPFHFTSRFYNEKGNPPPLKPTCLYDFVEPFFGELMDSITDLKGRIQIEVIQGDFADVCEQIRFCWDDPEYKRPDTFPLAFDRVNLSNVPDYVGGHLSTFLYTMPILEERTTCAVLSNCLRNTPVWNTFEDFTTEYQLITSDEMLRQLTQVLVTYKGNPPMPLANYTAYRRTLPHKPHDFDALLPVKPFKKWFYGLFFKLAIPMTCDIRNYNTIIISPLNLTILLRLIAELCSIGYPHHWLSDCLTNIISNKVTTTCRPPRTLPLSISEARREYPPKKLCTAPFLDDLSTLTRLFSSLLPFTVPATLLPPLSSITCYTFHLPSYIDVGTPSANLLLCFWDGSILGTRIEDNLRNQLDPSWGDEVDDEFKGTSFEDLREKGFVVWSTFKWDTKNKVATVWMPESTVDRFKKLDWRVGMWRCDTWRPVFHKARRVVEAAVQGERWESSV